MADGDVAVEAGTRETDPTNGDDLDRVQRALVRMWARIVVEEIRKELEQQAAAAPSG
jgi:hypothetical protein